MPTGFGGRIGASVKRSHHRVVFLQGTILSGCSGAGRRRSLEASGASGFVCLASLFYILRDVGDFCPPPTLPLGLAVFPGDNLHFVFCVFLDCFATCISRTVCFSLNFASRSAKNATSMRSVEDSIVVSAPIDLVYAKWTRIEDFPKFMSIANV